MCISAPMRLPISLTRSTSKPSKRAVFLLVLPRRIGRIGADFERLGIGRRADGQPGERRGGDKRKCSELRFHSLLPVLFQTRRKSCAQLSTERRFVSSLKFLGPGARTRAAVAADSKQAGLNNEPTIGGAGQGESGRSGARFRSMRCARSFPRFSPTAPAPSSSSTTPPARRSRRACSTRSTIISSITTSSAAAATARAARSTSPSPRRARASRS